MKHWAVVHSSLIATNGDYIAEISHDWLEKADNGGYMPLQCLFVVFEEPVSWSFQQLLAVLSS